MLKGPVKTTSGTSLPDHTADGPSPQSTAGIPSHDATTLNGVPVNILEFRTIISMLDHARGPKPFKIKDSENPRGDDVHRQELKLCSAFAALSVMRTEIVSVVTKPMINTQQVIVYAQYPEYMPSPARQSTLFDRSPRLLSVFFSYFTFTANPDYSAKGKDRPKEVSLNNPQDLCPGWENGVSDRQILEYIEDSR